jgi:hypothetical protein
MHGYITRNCSVISIIEFQLWFKTKPNLNMSLSGLFQLSILKPSH